MPCFVLTLYTLNFFTCKKGLECCSDTSISFHYMTNEEINAINTFLNNRTQIGRNLTFEDIINELKRLSLFHGNDVE